MERQDRKPWGSRAQGRQCASRAALGARPCSATVRGCFRHLRCCTRHHAGPVPSCHQRCLRCHDGMLRRWVGLVTCGAAPGAGAAPLVLLRFISFSARAGAPLKLSRNWARHRDARGRLCEQHTGGKALEAFAHVCWPVGSAMTTTRRSRSAADSAPRSIVFFFCRSLALRSTNEPSAFATASDFVFANVSRCEAHAGAQRRPLATAWMQRSRRQGSGEQTRRRCRPAPLACQRRGSPAWSAARWWTRRRPQTQSRPGRAADTSSSPQCP